MDEEEWSQEYDKVPNIFLNCELDCQVLVCKACWDQGIEKCPNCRQTVDPSPSEVTFTEKLEDPSRVLEVTLPHAGQQDVDPKPWKGKLRPRAYQEAAFKAAACENRRLDPCFATLSHSRLLSPIRIEIRLARCYLIFSQDPCHANWDWQDAGGDHAA